jgi:hypothetical protein
VCFWGSVQLVPGLIAFGLLFSSFALANIVAGSSTTNVSSDVSYTSLTLSKPSDALQGDVLLANVSVDHGSPATISSSIVRLKTICRGIEPDAVCE